MTVKTKKFDCLKFKDELQANTWKRSKARNLTEYITWLTAETAKISLNH